ncbi:bidirectional sugar transporter NEC1-like [Solanum stenotomum]|uniref:bidirectional sugar transporter NEC1-like n=1 Tax=Solanum stenotomum TaxID=172797 RepID=UPI0020D03ACE|nr:bidirectional sugar transporter NEC1-like [Solanum stenotomum]
MPLFTTIQLAFAFGILGNGVSFLVYLSPLPTFYRIFKRKSTEGFQSIPYSVSLFSAMLYLYYAYLKKNEILLITINSFGTGIQLIYLTIFMIYATKSAKIFATKLLIGFNIVAFGAIVGLTYIFAKENELRISIVGWICAVFSVSVFAAPLSIMRRVIQTKSVEFMPFPLSFFLTICAVMWFFYGLLKKDMYIAMPNILGFSFGIAQMILYAIYRNRKQQVLPDLSLMDLKEIAIDMKTVVVEIIQENVDDENKNKNKNKQEEVDSVDEKKDDNDKQDVVALTTSNV